jgi:thioredoxin reductase/NAD-dependent dihydropyrimidine dehydrogenase PreA subunit
VSDGAIILASGLLLALLFMVPFVVGLRRREQATREAELQALRYGLHEPVTLHPVVDPDVCIGSGACVRACPEVDVLGLIDGQARAVAPGRCVGHGLCERSCPVEAIQLVFGTEKRGVDLPRMQGNFETNVPGLYVVGELGGMGLIRNAFAQGRQCVEGIDRELRRNGHGPRRGTSGEGESESELLDVVVVGCGPAGLSASLECLQRGLRFRTIEREPDLGGTVRHYPRKKLVMTSAFDVPGHGKVKAGEIQKDGLIGLWREVLEESGLEVNRGETVLQVNRSNGNGFKIVTDKNAYRARRVVLAIGRRGVPRKLGVPGEELPNVAYSLREPEAYQGDRVLVVGGGDSAVEAALALSSEAGNTVRLSYRGERFTRIKPANHDRIEAAVAGGELEVLFGTNLVEVAPDQVVLEDGEGRRRALPNDQVLVFIGGTLPTPFLESCGIAVDTKFGTP